MFETRNTEVAIVGGGPVGLLAALVLAERGVRIQVFDKDRRTVLHSYALAIHPETLRLLDELRLADRLVEQGHAVRTLAFYEDGRRQAEVDFSGLGGKYPFVLVLPQSRLEAAFEERLQEHKVRVHWNHRVQDIAIGEDGLKLEVSRFDQVTTGYPIARTEWVVTKTYHVEAAHAVGADGYHSMVRRKVGAESRNLGGAQAFSVYELSAAGALPNEARVFFTEDGSNVYWPLGGERCRFSFEVPDAYFHGPSERRLEGLLAARAPWFSAEIRGIHWSTAVQFERRLATRFGAGRLWLAGDAAHLTGPMGAQSMNVGLREAAQVGRRLAEALRTGTAAEQMEAYDGDRREEWTRLLGLGGEPVALPDATAWTSANRERILSAIPASGRDLDTLLRQLGLTLGA